MRVYQGERANDPAQNQASHRLLRAHTSSALCNENDEMRFRLGFPASLYANRTLLPAFPWNTCAVHVKLFALKLPYSAVIAGPSPTGKLKSTATRHCDTSISSLFKTCFNFGGKGCIAGCSSLSLEREARADLVGCLVRFCVSREAPRPRVTPVPSLTL